jgi:hypothetical protein
MLIVPRSYEMRKLRKNTNIFFHNILNKSFDEIKNDFDMLSPRRQHAILYCCQNLPSCKPLQPIIMMATLLPEITQQVTAELLDYDQKSIKLFYSLPIKEALNQYKNAQHQAKKYRNLPSPGLFNLPIGFHYRATDEACQLISKIISRKDNYLHLAGMIHTKIEYLTSEDMQQWDTLTQSDNSLSEKLNIKGQIIQIQDNTQPFPALPLTTSFATKGLFTTFCLGLFFQSKIIFFASIPLFLTAVKNTKYEFKTIL